MHFQQPELLYALFLLIIPLIVHLFRLRKFQKEDFTNVKFLKKVIQETRKSSRLKKFLILITRLLLFSCLIIAFAKPFIPASDKALTESQTLFYLDNSFSMQAGNDQSSNFQRAKNDLLKGLEGDGKISLFTNEKDYLNRSVTQLKEEIQNIELSENQISYREIKLKGDNYFKKFPASENHLVFISDFQNNLNLPLEITTENINYHFISQRSDRPENISIDTAFIENSTPETVSLSLKVSSITEQEEPITISIYNGEELLGRNTIQFSSERTSEVSFRLENKMIANGRIELKDAGLKYDNQLYFNISDNPKIKVIVISSQDADFLNRIYNEPEFETLNFSPDQVDFNQLNNANLIVLNEVEKLPSSLINNLKSVKEKGASVIIIPPSNAEGYNQLLNSIGFPSFTQKVENERLITDISFDHPLLQNVFEDRIENFEYPKVLSSYNLNSDNTILKFQDNNAFLAASNSAYLFTAALNPDNSNFRNSPLIVPVFYQIGLTSLKMNQLYYLTAEENMIDIPVQLGKDQVLHLIRENSDIIPQQQNYSNRVEINTGNIDLEAGNYTISNDNNELGHISFNYSSNESELIYSDLTNFEGVKIYDSVEDYFSKVNATTQITSLWKWFIIFALILLAIEMLLIKFLK